MGRPCLEAKWRVARNEKKPRNQKARKDGPPERVAIVRLGRGSYDE